MKSEQFDNIKQIELRTRRIIELLTILSNSGCDCSAELNAILLELQDIDSKLVTTNNTLSNIFNSVDDLENLLSTGNVYLSNIEGYISNIDTLLTSIESNVSSLLSYVSNVDSTLINIDSTLTSINTTLASISTDVSNISSTLLNIDSNISSLLSYVASIDNNVLNVYNFISNPTPLYTHNIIQGDYNAPFFGFTNPGLYSVAFIFYNNGSGFINGVYHDDTMPALVFTANSEHRQGLPSMSFDVTTGNLKVIQMTY